MKKITLLFTLMISMISLGQTPIITMISDGDCYGGTPKVVEIYAQGTVDFSNYSLQKSTNGGDFGSNFNLSDLGTATDEFVYIYRDGETEGGSSIFAAEYPSASNTFATTSDAVNFNGDDAIRLVLDSDSSVIDQYGNEEDGTGTPWEYKDGYAKRNNGTTPNGTFVVTDWTFNNGALNEEGNCQSGTNFEDIINLGTYEATNQGGDAALLITAPADNMTYSPNTSEVTVEFAISNFTISSSATEANGDGYVQYSTDNGATYINKFDAEDIVLADLDAGDYTVMIQLVDNNGDALDPAIEDMVSFSIAMATQVTSITELRADVETNGVGSYYEITGNSLVTWTDGYNNRRWIQDETVSGILIFDEDEVIAGDAYTAGDMVSGLVGYTVDFNGVLQFIPSEDAGTVESSGNTVAPQVITVAEFAANYEDYESEYIAFQDVTINDSEGEDADGTFQTGTNYPVVSGTDETEMRTDFYGADYIGEMIPSAPTTITAVAGEFNGNHQVFATNVDATLAADNFTASAFTLYPNPTSNGAVAIQTETSGAVNVEIYNLLGKRALTAKNVNGNLNVSTLNAGVYLVKVTQNGVSSTKKLIVK